MGEQIIKVEKRLDAANSPQLRSTIKIAIENDQCRKMVVDLSETTFIDSSGLAALIGGLKSMRAAQGKYVLAGITGSAREIFDLTRMDLVFTIYSTVAEAKAALGAS